MWPLPPNNGEGSGAAWGTVGGAQGKGPCGLPGSGRARARPRRWASARRPLRARGDRLVAAQRGEDIFHELRVVVRLEAHDVVTNVGRELLCRAHAGCSLAPKEIEQAHARRVMLQNNQAQSPPQQIRFAWGQ